MAHSLSSSAAVQPATKQQPTPRPRCPGDDDRARNRWWRCAFARLHSVENDDRNRWRHLIWSAHRRNGLADASTTVDEDALVRRVSNIRTHAARHDRAAGKPCAIIRGTARFTSPDSVEVDTAEGVQQIDFDLRSSRRVLVHAFRVVQSRS